MIEVDIPKDREALATLARTILDRNAEAAKQSGVEPARAEIKAIRVVLAGVEPPLGKLRRHELAAAPLAEALRPKIAALEKALRDFAQILKRRLKDVRLLRRWWFRLTRTKAGYEVTLPQDRDEIATLARNVLKKHPKAARATGVQTPRPELRALKVASREVDRGLKALLRHEDPARAYGKALLPRLHRLRRAVRDFAQVQKRRLPDPKWLERWGFTVRETRKTAAKADIPPPPA